VTFTLSVENIGGEDASNVHARIFGLGTDWLGSDWVTTANRDKPLVGILDRSNPEQSLPGGSGDLQWTVTAPVGLKVDNTYTAGVRVYYDYKTTALANVKVYNTNYLKTNPSEASRAQSTSGIETFTVTNAPITVELAGLARPLIYKGSNVTQQAGVTIMINNVGPGYPYSTSENDMTVHVNRILVNNQPCKNAVTVEQKLPKNGAKAVSCMFDIPNIDSYSTIPLEVELGYRYFLDGSSSIKVLKSMTGTSSGSGSTGGTSGGLTTTVCDPASGELCTP
jgi:hypothetical protein